MIKHWFEVELTNGKANNKYKIYAFNETEATILAQAEAINEGKGYKLVSITKLD